MGAGRSRAKLLTLPAAKFSVPQYSVRTRYRFAKPLNKVASELALGYELDVPFPSSALSISCRSICCARFSPA